MHIAIAPERYAGKQVGNGSCALYVQRVSKVGLTKGWRRGRHVRGNDIPKNTIIATFSGSPPRYPNRRDGSSHAAVFIRQEGATGLRVWDQWVGRPVAQRTIRFKGGVGTANNDGDRYYVVTT